ncbi:LUD domain-containing protein [Roseomonas sp. NAR14]|uniref:LUD domain-containing protein n=1 Tax=Roseomonas acroporae TaxID=2937791 RepID=A0A9X1Y8G4_9PROT|nr:LUD domain-containing protein [Roseomonas acroporae]MCK8785859.1 LUD domain-containing protein [Roseomonas acroporae]
MSTRETILDSVRAALGRRRPDPAAIAAEAAALLADPAAIRPALPVPDPVEAFALRVVSPKVGATLERIAALGALPAAVARYLDAHGLPHALALQPDPELRALDWAGYALRDTARPDEAAALGQALWGIAETGTLVFHSGADTAVLNHFLPLHHIAVLQAPRILPYLEDYAALSDPAPRNANLVTGASGTTDIEGSYVRGAHGPRFLHVVLVG